VAPGVTLYPAAAAKESPPVFAAPPAADQALDATALPVGGFVRVGIELTGFDFTPVGKGAFTVAVHDDLRNQLVAVGPPVAGKAVVMTVQVPDVGNRDGVVFTVLVREAGSGAADRMGAAPATLPLPVDRYDLTNEYAPKIRIDPLAGAANAVILPSGGATLPFKISMSNPSPSAVTGDLHFDPAKPAADKLGQAGVVVGKIRQVPQEEAGPQPVVAPDKNFVGPVVPVAVSKDATSGWFWVASGKDEFLRPFTVVPTAPPLTFVPSDLKVSVDGGSKLQFENTGKGEITLTSVKSAAPPQDDMTKATVVVIPVGQEKIAASEKLSLTPTDPAAPPWRIWIDFAEGKNSRSAAVDLP
jgi:hypothetical protein